MHFFYNIGIRLYGFGIRVASIFNPKAKEWIVGRKNIFENLPKVNGENVVWFHCASLGEFDQGIPLMKKIVNEDPSVFLLVTFFSPSGMKFYQKRERIADHVMYLPLDTPKNAKRFINYFKPKKAFFVKYEFWYNFIAQAKSQQTRIYNVSGLFRGEQRFFKWYGGLFRKLLQKFDWFFVQNEKSKDLLSSIGIENVTITGDSRFDRVLENKELATENKLIEQFKNDENLFVIGSSWPEDEAILIPWIKKFKGKVLIAPHNVDENHVVAIQEQLPGSIRYTQAENVDLTEKNILILDTIGQLANAYSYGKIAYIGGGFSGSLHNILEPAVFGLPVIFGPKHKRFPEGEAFIESGFGFSVASTVEFEEAYQTIVENYEEVSEKEVEFVGRNAGASERIMEELGNKVDSTVSTENHGEGTEVHRGS